MCKARDLNFKRKLNSETIIFKTKNQCLFNINQLQDYSVAKTPRFVHFCLALKYKFLNIREKYPPV